MKKAHGFRILAVLLLVMAPLGLMAQGFQVGNVSGVVSDETGGALPGVTVTIHSTERGLTRTEMTDANGRFRFPSLPLGIYGVEATLSGFQTASRSNVRVEAERTTNTDLTLRLAAETAEITVTAESPIVDPTNATQTTRISSDEYEKTPVGRSYQTLARLAPGVVGGANPNSSGALSSNNQYLFDGIDATDPTTGTFGSNLNFEAIQEVNVMTNGVSAEYGRATGAIVSVVTKSGTNELEGSLKAIVTNDKWDEQNTTVNRTNGNSFARVKTDEENIRYSGTLGGPVWRDRAWFFGAYEEFESKGSPQTTILTNEEWASNPILELHNYRLTGQITPSHQVWVKYAEDPYLGIVRGDYGGSNGDLYSVVEQGQGGDNKAIQYSGVIGSRLSLEAMYAESTSSILVGNYRAPGPFDGGSAVRDSNTGRYVNGLYFATGDNVSRPRDQINAAATYFATLGGNTHDIKLGLDFQDVESTAQYRFTNNRLYYIFFNIDDYTMDTSQEGTRFDFADLGPQTSTGGVDSVYLRDKFSAGSRLNFEVGVRYEDQSGFNDLGVPVVDSQVFSPRLAGTFDLSGDGRTIVTATAGRFHDFILQTFVDGYAQTVQRGVYDVFTWDIPNQEWVFAETVNPVAGGIDPNLGLTPTYTDEITLGFQRQLGATMGFGIRGISREWNDLIDDFRRFEGGSTVFDYENSDIAERKYMGIQTTFEKRFSENWSLLANYTYSETEGNHFGNNATGVNNFRDNMCRGIADPTIGDIPCIEAERSLYGNPGYDYPHFANLVGMYSRPIGPVNLTVGGVGNFGSGQSYSKVGTVRVLNDDGTESGQNLTYNYEGLGSERLDDIWTIDGSVEATYRVWGDAEIGVKGEVFNITDNQDPSNINGVSIQTWCNDDTPTCATQRANHGATTQRTAFQLPRGYRFSAIIRF